LPGCEGGIAILLPLYVRLLSGDLAILGRRVPLWHHYIEHHFLLLGFTGITVPPGL